MIVPIQYKEQIKSVAHFGVLFHNDCLYLAHALMEISRNSSLLSQEQLDEDTRLLHQRGHYYLNLQIVARVHNLAVNVHQKKHQLSVKDHLLACGDLSSTHKDEKFELVEKAVKKVLFLLKHASRSWEVWLHYCCI